LFAEAFNGLLQQNLPKPEVANRRRCSPTSNAGRWAAS
jgi:hypothetical protein